VSLHDDASMAYSGELTFIDNGVDRTTGTITARATVPNRSSRFYPASTCAFACTFAMNLTLPGPQVAWDRASSENMS